MLRDNLTRLRAGLLLLGLTVYRVAVEVDAADLPRIVSLAPHLSELVFDAECRRHADRRRGIQRSSHRPRGRCPGSATLFASTGSDWRNSTPDLVLAWRGRHSNRCDPSNCREDGYDVRVYDTSDPEDVATDARRDRSTSPGHGERARLKARAQEYLDALCAPCCDSVMAIRRPVTRVFVQISPRPLYTVNGRQIIGRVVELMWRQQHLLANWMNWRRSSAKKPYVAAGSSGHPGHGPRPATTSSPAGNGVPRRCVQSADQQLYHLDPDLSSPGRRCGWRRVRGSPVRKSIWHDAPAR